MASSNAAGGLEKKAETRSSGNDEDYVELARFLRGQSQCVRIFIAGAQSHVGKTSLCLAILGYLKTRCGLDASELAYIKPATQCEAPDLLGAWCAKHNVAHVAGKDAPIVFYSGFTRAVISGETRADLLKVRDTIQTLCEPPRKVCVVDGVGFPGVGSCVQASNADVARVVNAPVVLVSPSGVGAAVDAHCLGAAFFEKHGVPVLGAVLNRAPSHTDGFYGADAVRGPVAAFFRDSRPRETLFGVVPVLKDLDGLREKMIDTTNDDASAESSFFDNLDALAAANVEHFAAHVALDDLLRAAALDASNRKRPLVVVPRRKAAPPSPELRGVAAHDVTPTTEASASRADIEARARASGAPGAR